MPACHNNISDARGPLLVLVYYAAINTHTCSWLWSASSRLSVGFYELFGLGWGSRWLVVAVSGIEQQICLLLEHLVCAGLIHLQPQCVIVWYTGHCAHPNLH